MKKIIATILIMAMLMLSGCASLDRGIKDLKSDLSNGIERTLTVYTATGEVMARYNGKIDLASTEGGIVKFDLNGKRYMYYNCFVEVIEEEEP